MLVYSLTTSLTVVVVGIEASVQQLRHFIHLIVLDEVHELPQIGLHKNQRRERAIRARGKEQMVVGVRERKSCKKTEIVGEMEKGVEGQTQARVGEKWKRSGRRCETEGDSLLKMEGFKVE